MSSNQIDWVVVDRHAVPKKSYAWVKEDPYALLVFADEHTWVDTPLAFAGVADDADHMVHVACSTKWYHGYNVKTMHIVMQDGKEVAASVNYIKRLGDNTSLPKELRKIVAAQVVTVGRTPSKC